MVLSQFTSQLNKQTLANYFDVAKDVYPVGRLDEDSEGLLLLTNDTLLNHRLLNPGFAHEREYWVQVDGNITTDAITKLQTGIEISVDGKPYTTKKCSAARFDIEPDVPQRQPPIRYRKEIPAPWIKLTLTEGKNRQVRKMTAKVGFPTLRLLRYRIEGLTMDGMKPGEILRLPKNTVYKKLFSQHG